MLSTQLVKKAFLFSKMVAFYLIHIIVKKVMMVLHVFADIKFQSKCFIKHHLQLRLKKMMMVGR